MRGGEALRSPLEILCVSLIACISAALLLPGCVSPPQRGKLEVKLGADPRSARQLGLLLGEYANAFANTVKISADQMETRTAELSVRRAALQWKIKAVPAAFTAVSHEDPFLGLTDVWILAIQQRELFERDDASQIFGAEQGTAIDAARVLEERIEIVARMVVTSPDGIIDLKAFVRKFSRENPIEDLSFFRASLVPHYVKFVRERTDLVQELSAFRGYAETALGFALVGLNHAPEIARWQAELTLLDAETYPVIDRTLQSVDALGIAATQLTQVTADLNAEIDAQRDAVLRDLERQRIETLRDIEAMRRAAFADLAREREAVLSGLDLRLTGVLDSLRTERETLTAQVPLVAEQAGAAVMPLTREVIDHAFWRALQLLLVLLVVLVVSALVLRWTRKSDAAVAVQK